MVGQWTRSPWVAYLVPALLFVSVHNNGWRGQLSVLTFALCGAFLTWSTGGLEASISATILATAAICWLIARASGIVSKSRPR